MDLRSFRRVVTHTVLLGLIPLATASAQPLVTATSQPYGFVRVTHDDTKVECFWKKKAVCMTAPQGTVLEVLYIDGDRYNHRNSNWYWVLLPPDQWGRRVTGWLRGNAVEHLLPPPAPTLTANADPTPKPERHEPAETPIAAPAEAAAKTVIPDLVLNFEFGKSALTEEARRKLDGADVRRTSSVQGLTIEVDGHTDWVGSGAYNQRLGLARAETVKRYLTQHLGVPADRINVISYGEREPVAANTTRQGRAQNRRVMIKSGS